MADDELSVLQSPDPPPGNDIHGGTDYAEETLQKIFRLVQTRTGHDFSSYKRNTLLRRIERRMQLNGTDRLDHYLEYLEREQEEAGGFLQEVLIGVTGFFRDPEAFQTLKQRVLPELVARHSPDRPLRIWHPCCASGEEVYSLAMLLREYCQEHHQELRVLIFASDLDEAALAQARSGLYTEESLATLDQHRREAFFTRNGDQHQVVKSLREMVVFAQHSVIKDPPFSRLDMLVCRNFLIYLNNDLQKRLISLFHQVLVPEGILFLGSAENVERHSDLFAPLDKKWKIYRRLAGPRTANPVLPFSLPTQSWTPCSRTARSTEAGEADRLAVAEKALAQRFAPPCALVDEHFETVGYTSSRIGRYLIIPTGEPTRDILKNSREELRPALRTAIHKAFAEQKPVSFRGLRVSINDQTELVDISAEPLGDSGARKLVMVLFEACSPLPPPSDDPASPPLSGDNAKDLLIRQLEEQIRASHEQLQATIEQLEVSNERFVTTNEELLSINEEFQSTNEELQSTNEELETSKEELQVLNEELTTVNAELQEKVEELNQSNCDMENLFNSSGVATIFLDPNLVIKRYSPAMASLFNLIPSDLGRPFRHLAGTIDWSGLTADAQEVLSSSRPLEREVTALEGGTHYLLRVLPYRTGDGTVNGIVVTLVDISLLKRVERSVLEMERKLRLFVEHAPAAISMFDTEMRYLIVSRKWLTDYGLDGQNIIGKSHYQVFPEIPERWRQVHQRCLAGAEESCAEDMFLRADGRVEWVRWEMLPWHDASGRIGGAILFSEVITERKKAEEALQASEERYRSLVEQAPLPIYINRNFRVDYANPAARQLFTGQADGHILGISPLELVHPDDRAVASERIDRLLRGEAVPQAQVRVLRLDGEVRDVEVVGSTINDQQGPAILVMMQDITERKRAEQALQTSERRWRDLAEAMPQLVWTCSARGRCDYLSRQWAEYTGVPVTELLGNGWLDQVHPDDRTAIDAAWRAAVDSTGLFDAEYRVRRRDGMYRWFKTRGVPIRSTSGEVLTWYGSNTDIHDLKLVEEELRQHMAELQRSNRDLERFTKVSVGRELRMIQLKEEVNRLCSRIGEAEPYPLEFIEEES